VRQGDQAADSLIKSREPFVLRHCELSTGFRRHNPGIFMGHQNVAHQKFDSVFDHPTLQAFSKMSICVVLNRFLWRESRNPANKGSANSCDHIQSDLSNPFEATAASCRLFVVFNVFLGFYSVFDF
jgi:hypothetical protein